MEKTYKPQAIESQWYQKWEENGYFAPSGQGESYSIMIPPPNVTGSLHMGHAFNQTLIPKIKIMDRQLKNFALGLTTPCSFQS